MERLNFQAIEKKMAKQFEKTNLNRKVEKNFIV